MKLGRVSLTVPRELLEKSEKIAKEKLEDRSTVMRELLALGLKQYMIKDSLEMYVEGKISMEKAAELADVSIWKFLDVLKERKIPLRYDLEDIKKEIEDIVQMNKMAGFIMMKMIKTKELKLYIEDTANFKKKIGARSQL